MDKDSNRVGRTAYDFISDLFDRKTLLLLFTCIVLVTAALVAYVRFDAQDGTEINLLWGLIKYQTAKRPGTLSPQTAPPADVRDYALPKKAQLSHSALIPILDRAVYVRLMPDNTVSVSGSNVELIKLAIRSESGEALSLTPTPGAFYMECPSICVIELSYKGNYFAGSIEQDYRGERFLSLWQIGVPTLILRPLADQ